MERVYDVYVINDKTGYKVKMNRTPMTHNEACTFKSKLIQHKNARHILVEITGQ